MHPSSSIDLFHPVYLPEMQVAAADILRSGQIASGAKIIELERAFSAMVGRDNIVSTNDLTSAVLLALYLSGVRSGDEVATVAFSCLQSNSPIATLGAHPVWIDIDPETMSMSLEDLKKKLTLSVKAVMVYHIAGYPANMAQIAEMCRDRGIPLIEDCNNAIGATLDGRSVGAYGDYAVFSLYPNRQINGIDGGLLATPDSSTAKRAARLRRFGVNSETFRDARGEINPASDVPEIGWSASLNQLNAAVALCQFDTLPERIAQTRAIATRLTTELSGLRRLRSVKPVQGAIPAFWGFLVLSEDRDGLIDFLKVRGIKSSIFHQRNDLYTGFGSERANLPGTTEVMAKLLALPCGWWLTDSQVDYLIGQVSEFDIK
jgi:perosamine synthetase